MQRSRLVSAVLCVAICLSLTGVDRAKAQEDFVKGLLRGLVESQLEKARRKGQLKDPFRDPNGQQNLRPTTLTPQMQRLRPISASFAQESATLVALLNSDAHRNYNVRPLLTDAIKLQATATALNQRNATVPNHLFVVDSFRDLNSNWVTYSRQLEQSRHVGARAKQCVKRLTALDKQYCDILGIRPQLNTHELVREVYTLDAHVHDLMDDVSHRSNRNEASQTLRHKLSRHHHQVSFFAEQVANGASLESGMQQYRALYASWQAMQADLSTVSGHAVARDIRQIQESHQKIHELLGLQVGLNRDILLHLVHETTEEMTELMRMITLEQLIRLPDASLIPEAADAFDGTVQNLDSVLHIEEDLQVIGEAWVYADDAWQVLAYYLSPIKNPQARALMGSVGENLQTLQRSIGVRVEFDRSSLYRSASQLEETADHLIETIRLWHSHPGKHDGGVLRLAQQLSHQCHILEQAVINQQKSPAYCRQQCDSVIAIWQKIRPALNECDTDERPTLNFIVSAFTPELIRLRTMLGE